MNPTTSNTTTAQQLYWSLWISKFGPFFEAAEQGLRRKAKLGSGAANTTVGLEHGLADQAILFRLKGTQAFARCRWCGGRGNGGVRSGLGRSAPIQPVQIQCQPAAIFIASQQR